MMEEKIDNYILGRLSAEQTQAFEELMANDEELRGEVALRREMITAVHCNLNRSCAGRLDGIRLCGLGYKLR